MEQKYRELLIRGAMLKGKPQAAVFAGKKRLHICEGTTIEVAMAGAQAFVDRVFAEAAANRRKPHIPTAEEYVRYFAAHPPAEHELAMLKAHAVAPKSMLTASELAEAAGWISFSSANIHYGTLGRNVAETLGLSIQNGHGEEMAWTSALAEYVEVGPERAKDGHCWRMHPELAEALSILGIAP